MQVDRPQRARPPRAPGSPRARAHAVRPAGASAARAGDVVQRASAPAGEHAVERQQQLRVVCEPTWIGIRTGAATTHATANTHGRRWTSAAAPASAATPTARAPAPIAGWLERSVPSRWTDESSRPAASHTLPTAHARTPIRRTSGRPVARSAHRPAAARMAAAVWLVTGTHRHDSRARRRLAPRMTTHRRGDGQDARGLSGAGTGRRRAARVAGVADRRPPTSCDTRTRSSRRRGSTASASCSRPPQAHPPRRPLVITSAGRTPNAVYFLRAPRPWTESASRGRPRGPRPAAAARRPVRDRSRPERPRAFRSRHESGTGSSHDARAGGRCSSCDA